MGDITTFLETWTAAERRSDTAALDAGLTDDFVGVGPSPGELTYETFDLDEVKVRVHGDAAVVTARQTGKGTYQGHPVPEAVRATLVLVSDTGTWQLAGIHMSFIAGTPGALPLPATKGDDR